MSPHRSVSQVVHGALEPELPPLDGRHVVRRGRAVEERHRVVVVVAIVAIPAEVLLLSVKGSYPRRSWLDE